MKPIGNEEISSLFVLGEKIDKTLYVTITTNVNGMTCHPLVLTKKEKLTLKHG